MKVSLNAGRLRVMAVTAVLVGLVAIFDWAVGNTISLAVLYILPMMLGAIVLRSGETALLALVCALLRARFDVPATTGETALRLVFAFFSYLCAAFFVTALVRNRQLAIEHLRDLEREHALRLKAEEELQILVESSPAAILTVNADGIVLAANNAANALFSVGERATLRGRDIGRYLPVLSDALLLPAGVGEFRTSAQCQGFRSSGDIFLANTWFSSYVTAEGVHLAAIVVDASEEMRDREEQNLRELLTYNRIAATAIAHEVRNTCAAASLLSHSLAREDFAANDDFRALISLVTGLEKIASFQMHSQSQPGAEIIALQDVLDNLRIIVEPEWRDIGGEVLWPAGTLPRVVADPHGLLQALLNLMQNSRRAVLNSPVRQVTLSIEVSADTTLLRLQDTGPGVSDPDLLFQPFHPAADGTGLGLYISRALVRNHGGDLRLEAGSNSCFVIQLQIAG